MGGRPDARAARVVDLLDAADRAIDACLTRVTVAASLSREQWRTLMMLDEGTDPEGTDPPGHTMGEVATRVVVPAPTATRVVDKLVADGLAFRRSDPWDRRRVLVHISGEGRALVGAVADELDASLGAVLAQVGAEDRHDVLALLDRVRASVERDAPVGTA